MLSLDGGPPKCTIGDLLALHYRMNDGQLSKLNQTTKEKIRSAASDAYLSVLEIGQSNNPKAISFLKQFTENSDTLIRACSLSGFGMIGQKDTLGFLKDKYNQYVDIDRFMALKSIGDIGTPEAIQFLKDARNDPQYNSELGFKDAAPVRHVCIENGEAMCFDGQMLGIIRDGFERHGITSEVYTGNRPGGCSCYLTYMCERTWDLATYMHHAELRLYRDNAQIGYAEYHLAGKGGLALTKFAGTKEKMDPVIDELLSDYPIAK